MKITFILPIADMSGGVKVVAIYAKALEQRGHEVVVVSLPPATVTLRHKVRSLIRHNHWPRDKRVSLSHLDNTGLDHRILDRWRPVTDADVPDADLVIATWWETAEWVARLSPRKGAKVYFIQHHEVFDYLPIERVKATWRLPLQKITISKWLVELAARDYGDRNVALVPNAVDLAQFNAPPRGRQPQPTVGMLYATVKWKGCNVSLQAFARAARRIPNLRLIAFGAEPLSKTLPLPAGAVFHHLPPQNEIRNLYASCDVWLCGSYSEGFHLPPLEAMACRCPVVSTSVGGPLDVVEPRRNGYLAPVGDALALGDRLLDVLNLDEAEWRRMSDAAFATATRYTWDDATDLLEKVLYSLAGDAPRGNKWTDQGLRQA